MPIISTMQKAIGKRITNWGWPQAKTQDSVWKTTKAKKAGDIVA
jgi:hypothetical protein